MLRVKFKSRVNSKLLSEFVPSGVTTKGSKKTVTIGGQRFRVVPADDQTAKDVMGFIKKASQNMPRRANYLKKLEDSLFVYKTEDFYSEFGSLLEESKEEGPRTPEQRLGSLDRRAKTILRTYATSRYKEDNDYTLERVKQDLQTLRDELGLPNDTDKTQRALDSKLIAATEKATEISKIDDPEELSNYLLSKAKIGMHRLSAQDAFYKKFPDSEEETGFYTTGTLSTPKTPEDTEKPLGYTGIKTKNIGGDKESEKDYVSKSFTYMFLIPEFTINNLVKIIEGVRDGLTTIPSFRGGGLERETKLSQGNYREIKEWYQDVNDLWGKLIKSKNVVRDEDKAKGFLGLLSSFCSLNSTWTQNLGEAIGLFDAVNRDLNEGKKEELLALLEWAESDTVNGYKFNSSKKNGVVTVNIKDNYENPFTKPKTTNFFLNTSDHTIAKRPEDGKVHENWWNTTQDRWMLRAFYLSNPDIQPKLDEDDILQGIITKLKLEKRKAKGQKRKKQIQDQIDELKSQKTELMTNFFSKQIYHDYLQAQTKKIADRLKIEVQEVQALLWVILMEESEGRFDSHAACINRGVVAIRKGREAVKELFKAEKNVNKGFKASSKEDVQKLHNEVIDILENDVKDMESFISIIPELNPRKGDKGSTEFLKTFFAEHYKTNDIKTLKNYNQEKVWKELTGGTNYPKAIGEIIRAKEFVIIENVPDFTVTYTMLAFLNINPRDTKIPPVLKGLRDYVEDKDDVKFSKLKDLAIKSYKEMDRKTGSSKPYKPADKLYEAKKLKRKLKIFLKSLG